MTASTVSIKFSKSSSKFINIRVNICCCCSVVVVLYPSIHSIVVKNAPYIFVTANVQGIRYQWPVELV